MKTAIVRTIILLTLYLSVCACGNKGDLYMPDKDKETINTETK